MSGNAVSGIDLAHLFAVQPFLKLLLESGK